MLLSFLIEKMEPWTIPRSCPCLDLKNNLSLLFFNLETQEKYPIILGQNFHTLQENNARGEVPFLYKTYLFLLGFPSVKWKKKSLGQSYKWPFLTLYQEITVTSASRTPVWKWMFRKKYCYFNIRLNFTADCDYFFQSFFQCRGCMILWIMKVQSVKIITKSTSLWF